MAFVHGNLVIGGFRVDCVACGQSLDFIPTDEIVPYFVYVSESGDVAYCPDCDQSQDDIIHPAVMDYACGLLRDKERRPGFVQRVLGILHACLLDHNSTDNGR